MEIEDIVREMAETIRGLAPFAGIPVIEEEKGDVETTDALKVARANACVMVGENGFTPYIQGETAPDGEVFGDAVFVATVFERPVIHRREAGAPGIRKMARTIARALRGASAEGMDAPLFLKRISPVQELGSSGSESSTVMCTVEFTTKTSI